MDQKIFKHFVGVDVSKDSLSIFEWGKQKYNEILYTKGNVKKFFKKFDPETTLVILENTGAYERNCMEVLQELGINIHRTNNNNFKHWTKFRNIKTKTDKIDSKMLARYGLEEWRNLKLFQFPKAEEEERKQLIIYLAGLKALRAKEKNKLKSPGLSCVEEEISETVQMLTERIEKIETKIKELIKNDNDFQKKVELLTEYKGVGEVTAMNVLASIPELGEVSGKTIAALVGVAPYRRDSGKKEGATSTKFLGRKRLKPLLFPAAMTAIRFNPEILKFYQKLLARGKKKMVAIVACMRKMIIHLNAILRDGGIKRETA